MSELAVLGCTLQASLATGTGTIAVPSIPVSNQPSSENFHTNGIVDKGIYFDKITAVIPSGTTVTLTPQPAGASSPTSIPLAVADSIDINGTADNILNKDNEKAVQKGDKGSKAITFTFLDTSAPTPKPTITVPVNVTVTVTDAGQTDVTAT